MPYALLHSRCPELADRETRTISILDGSEFDLPADQYCFLEMYCNEEGCDCRRVMFCVLSDKHPDAIQAVIAWGWEPREFYVKWMGDNDPPVIDSLVGPTLNLGSPETELSPALLELAQTVLLRDPKYVDRIKRHYAIFRKTVDTGRVEAEIQNQETRTPPPKTKVSPNNPCPCGSGRKFKKCCGRLA